MTPTPTLQELRDLLEPEATLRLAAQALLDQVKLAQITKIQKPVLALVEARFEAFYRANKEAGFMFPKELLKVYPKTEVLWAFNYLFSASGFGLIQVRDCNGGQILTPGSAVALAKILGGKITLNRSPRAEEDREAQTANALKMA